MTDSKSMLKHILLILFTITLVNCGGGAGTIDPGEEDPVIEEPTDPGTEDPGTGDPNAEEPPLTNAENTPAYLMAESIMARSPGAYGSWNYETATVLRGFQELYKATGEQKFYDYLKATVDQVISSQGNISGYSESEYNIDEVKEGSLVLYLYETTGEQKYKVAADALREQLNNHPRTNSGGFWHKYKYPWQMWLDGLYMGQPFYAHYSALFDESVNYDDILFQLTEMETRSIDANTGLLYHGWDEAIAQSWANPVTGTSPEFWGRSIGWYMMALVDVLDFIPAEYTTHRATLIDILQRQTVALEAFQDDDGVWWQVVDKVGQNGNWQESSATAMFVYAIAKGIRLGYLDDSHATTVQKGWAGLNNVFVTETNNGSLSLTNTCTGTGVGGSYSFYANRARNTNDPKGLGPFVLAGVEVELMNSSAP